MGTYPQVTLRIVVERPPRGVAFAVQRGKAALHQRTVSTGSDLTFELAVGVECSGSGPLDFRGEFVQGKRGERFVYVNSGTLADQPESAWTRRAKVWLKGFPRIRAEELSKAPPPIIVARFEGTGPDGGPACATVPLLGAGWKARD